MPEVNLDHKAEKDLRRIAKKDQTHILHTLRDELAIDAPNLNIKPIIGRPGWLRLRVGDYRVLYFSTGESYEVVRIVHKHDAVKAIASLPR